MSIFKHFSLTLTLLAATAAPALAHLDPQEHGSLMAGFSHPLFGMDHILVMVAVGLWAAQIARGGMSGVESRRALWSVPAAFVSTMAAGFGIAVAGLDLPFVEPAILASVIALGLFVAMAVKLPITASAAIVGVFALFHGHAHGDELGSAGALQFGIGFILATALLHAAGIGLGLGIARFNPYIARGLGGITALLGLSLIFG